MSPEPTPTKKAVPKFDNAAYAKKAEAAYLAAGGGRSFEDQCDDAFTAWQCFYDGTKAKSKDRIDIELTTPGDVSEAQAKAFSKKARMAFFNFIGSEFKKLDMIVTFVNGTDTGTTNRDDVPLLNR